MKQIIQLLLHHARKITQKQLNKITKKYRDLHSFKGEGRQVRHIVKDLKWGRENLQSNEKITVEIR